MLGLTLAFAILFSPEQRLERQLRSVREVVIIYHHNGQTDAKQLPLSVLQHLHVRRIEHSAGPARSQYQIRFGDLPPFWLWPNGELTTDDESSFQGLRVEISKGFYEKACFHKP